MLVIVAMNMSEAHRFRALLKGPWGDRIVLLLTFGLTVAVDLTVAIEVGVVLAAVLFMHRMTGVVAISTGAQVIEEDVDDSVAGASGRQRADLPPGVEVFQVRGPLFFGVAGNFTDVIDRIAGVPRVLILRLGGVPMVDASGASRLHDLLDRCRRHGTAVIVTGLQPQPRAVLTTMGILDDGVRLEPDFDAGLAAARKLAAAD